MNNRVLLLFIINRKPECALALSCSIFCILQRAHVLSHFRVPHIATAAEPKWRPVEILRDIEPSHSTETCGSRTAACRHGLRSRAAGSALSGRAGCGSAGPEHLYNRRNIKLILRSRYRMERNRRKSVDPRAG